MIMKEWPKVGDCLIVKSSTRPMRVEVKYSWNNAPYMKVIKDGCHLIFDNIIGYNLCCKICETLSELRILNKDYSRIRQFRGDMTLRVSETTLLKWVKPPPEPVELVFAMATKWRDGMINEYLAFRDAALGGLAAAKMVAEVRAHGGADAGLHT